MQSKLNALEKKIIVGGVNLLEKAEEQERLLEESAKELEERRKKAEVLKKKLEDKEVTRLYHLYLTIPHIVEVTYISKLAVCDGYHCIVLCIYVVDVCMYYVARAAQH